MLKLFYSPGACSLVPHVALEESAAEFDTVRVTLGQGEHLKPEYLAINPHARVPALGTEGGVITENIAILQFIAGLYRAPGAIPVHDVHAAARVTQLLSWFASSVHVAFAEVWRGSRFTDDQSLWPALEQGGRKLLAKQFDEIEMLCVDEWLVPTGYSAADGYALTFLRWAKRIGFDISAYPQWSELVTRVLERPAVSRALEREGLSMGEFQPDGAEESIRMRARS